MIKKIKIISVFVFYILLHIQCQKARTENRNLSKATIKIDSCGLYYKGNRLELGMQLSDWKKVLGKPSRSFIAYLEKDRGTFMWDNLGIAVDNFQNGEGEVAYVYIFFTNLNSPEGKAGQLNFARDWKEIDEKNYEPPLPLELLIKLKKENSPKNFIYPFTTYKGYINLHGFPVGAGMKIAEINSYRKNMTYSGQFGYVDQDIDGINDSGNTTDTFGGDYRAPGTECRDNRLQYYELTYTATGTLEYLKIGYESKNGYENRKIMENDIKERMK
jgi:hypothetical protein